VRVKKLNLKNFWMRSLLNWGIRRPRGVILIFLHIGINKIFDLFDDNKSELIDLTNLKRVAKELGETMTVEECIKFN
jgi:hypothetical protein